MSDTRPLLIVDDEASSLESLVRALSSFGYPCQTAESATEALRIAREKPPKLFLIDYRMPEVNGLEMIKHLRNDPDPAIAYAPVIVMTGRVEDEVLCLEAGADDFVTKPINLAALRARIDTQIRLSSMRTQLQKQAAEAEARREDLERDLDAARLTQQLLLPQKPPRIEGWDVAICYRPVMQVGGDIYGWLPMEEGRWLFWIADAAGRGAAAALLTTLAKLLFYHASVENEGACAMMQAMNRDFHGVLRGHSFMTAMAVVLDPQTGRISVCGAGHPPLLVSRFGHGTETVPSSLPPLGLAEQEVEATEMNLERGDAFVLYTDGLFGGEKNERSQSTPTQVAGALNPFAPDAQALLTQLLNHAEQRHRQEIAKDDVAVLVVRRKSSG